MLYLTKIIFGAVKQKYECFSSPLLATGLVKVLLKSLVFRFWRFILGFRRLLVSIRNKQTKKTVVSACNSLQRY